MSVLYGKFEMPEEIKVVEETPLFARFIAEPFEKGFGNTLGNALRRIMLTSLESPAIISITIEGVAHEYTAIPGVVEDMTHIILNLKGALLRKLPLEGTVGGRSQEVISKVLEITQDMLDKNGGSYSVRLKDILNQSNFEMVNPDLHIFAATSPMTKRVDIRVGIGRGYVPSERHTGFERKTDEIIIDSAFSPVSLVNYFVENTRVGQDTDYDKLILEVETDGRISPREALNFAVQIGLAHFKVFDVIKTNDLAFDHGVEECNKDKEELMHKLSLKIDEIELSVRSTNCLKTASVETIGELVVMPEIEMLKFRNFGKKSLTEIKQKLSDMGLSLGIDLSKYGINRDNVKALIIKYLEGEGE